LSVLAALFCVFQLALIAVEGVRRSLARLGELGRKEGFHAIVMGPMTPGTVAIIAEAGLPCYNTYERLPAGTWPVEWYVHFMHPRTGGHRLLAESLAAEFERLGWLAP
jgi:hypothetical protein